MPVDLNVLEHAAQGRQTRPPLVIAHGLFGSARNFSTLGRRLAAGRRVLMVDMRNHGASPWSDDMSYAAMAGDLTEVIRRRCDGTASVMGHSMGGKAVMALALLEPDVVVDVIVADIAPVVYPHTHAEIVSAMRQANLAGVARRSQADGLIAAAVPDPSLRAFVLQNLVIEDGAARWRLNLAALDAGMASLTGWPALSGTFGGPALFVYGGASAYMGTERIDAVREKFPAAEFSEIEGAGHWLHAEKPAEFLDIVGGWPCRSGPT